MIDVGWQVSCDVFGYGGMMSHVREALDPVFNGRVAGVCHVQARQRAMTMTTYDFWQGKVVSILRVASNGMVMVMVIVITV